MKQPAALQAIVLDASALIASIAQEKGAQIVDEHLPHAVMSTVNMAEVAAYIVRQGVPAAAVRNLLRDLAITLIPFDEEQALLTASLLPGTASKGLSLGDSACLSLAILKGLPVLTADRAWAQLGLDVKIELLR